MRIKANGTVNRPANIQAVIEASVPARAIIGPSKSQAIEPIMAPTPNIQAANDEMPTFIPAPIVLFNPAAVD